MLSENIYKHLTGLTPQAEEPVTKQFNQNETAAVVFDCVVVVVV